MRLTQMLGGLGRTAVIAATLLAGSTALAAAATLQLTTSFDLASRPAEPNTFPTDPNGLIGSRVTVDSYFADDATFQNNYVAAQSATVTVSGASVASANGTFDVTQLVGLFGNIAASTGGLGSVGSFFGSTFLSGISIPGIFQTIRLDANGTVGTRANGDLLTLAILQDVQLVGPYQGRPLSQVTNFTRYNFNVNNLTTTASRVGDVAPVPLPAALPLLLVGVGALAAIGRRRRRAAA